MRKIKSGILALIISAGSYGCGSDSGKTGTTAVTENNATTDTSIDSAGISTQTANELADTTAFPAKAASGSMLEITLGNVAQQKGADPEVKKFGQQMVTEHGKASMELQSLAASQNIILPTSPLPKHQKQIAIISELDGPELDRSYIAAMVKAHQEDIVLFESAASDTNVPGNLRAFAQKTLPALKMHLEMAQQIEAKLREAF